MKFTMLLSAVLLAIVSCSFAGASFGFFNDPKHPGKCMIRPDLVIAAGETVQNPDGCGRIICGNNGGATFLYCGTMGISEDCRFGKILHPDADYPKCCDREILC